METNLGKTKEEIIYELVLSLNKGDSYCAYEYGDASPRIELAIAQYNNLKHKGIIIEKEN